MGYLEPYEQKQHHEQAKAPQDGRGGVPLQLVHQAPAHPGVGNGQHNHAIQVEHAGDQTPA